MARTIKIDVWSDIACPWCYLGKHRLEAALRQFGERGDAPAVEVAYHSFQLAPDLPADYAGSHDDYLAARLGWSADRVQAANRHLQSLGAQYGLTYDFDTNRIANTRKAHELLHYAKAHGRQADVKERLLRAHFSEGVHIGDIEALADIAVEAGLDRDDAKRALEAGDHAAAVDEDIALASRYGITGVPFFVIDGRYGLSGAQEPAAFLQALEAAAAQQAGR
ncbi:DsbA family oxidoreductase [Pseudochelatococcus sp. B33]